MQSTWFNLIAIVAARMSAVAAAQNALWEDNPPWPLQLQGLDANKPDLLFVMHRGDRWISSAGLRDKRALRFVVGATNVRDKGEALTQADRLHFAARAALREASFLPVFQQAGALSLDEVEVEPDLKSAMAGGVVLMSAFEAQYQQTYPNAAR
jgi:hypothetical protein